ncbi:MAG: hypothetical protein Ct9H300mP14_12740 [Gammaproteobacteria bacterium]|nr:MAG: hypothetical protein Ct9H300mP14_12740 [Gammaproteobacteria bacterium]
MFENIKVIAESAGATLDDVVKLTVFITDWSNFEAMNQICIRYFSEPYPARTPVKMEIQVHCLWLMRLLLLNVIQELRIVKTFEADAGSIRKVLSDPVWHRDRLCAFISIIRQVASPSIGVDPSGLIIS